MEFIDTDLLNGGLKSMKYSFFCFLEGNYVWRNTQHLCGKSLNFLFCKYSLNSLRGRNEYLGNQYISGSFLG